ncbi:MAG: LacI family DNA-binding transcriptional regulator [Verrucomicrobia bacterium]|jgi:DNA-binding LacI/PurR family transcriptional regulator|nr:LacI family DNA-binding transcriptional regulator [Verrucomicrobiota bacterium]MBT7067973.1 LacI family DNA-binding transcriptional regulator [Verrucomicrobiota bacterium]MBT7701691.1 LacI family DNA-binding transcriptional regulator [Verrucomicrobiota bacterium]
MVKPTLKSIAQTVGVSPSAVSRVLNDRMGNTRVSEETVGRIKAVAGELGYVPNPVAASLRKGTTNNIGLILTTTANPFFTDMLHTFEEVATANGRAIIFNTSQNSIESELAAVRRLINCYASGVILTPWGDDSQVAVQEIIEKEGIDTPVVFISQTTDTGSYVRCDLVESYANATRELIARGYTKIGYLGNLQKGGRHEGLFTVLAEEGLSRDYRMPCRFTSEDGEFGSAYKGTLAWLESGGSLAEVYFCYSDLVAQGMFRALTEKGLRVPEDVAIVTTDNSVLAKTNSVPLTSIAYPAEEIARLAIEAVLEKRAIQKTLIAPVAWRGSTT